MAAADCQNHLRERVALGIINRDGHPLTQVVLTTRNAAPSRNIIPLRFWDKFALLSAQ